MQQKGRGRAIVGSCLGLFLWFWPGLAGRSESAQPARMPSAPFAVAAEPKNFSFIVYGDIQQSHREGHRRLVEQMLKEAAHFVLHSGDISPGGGRRYQSHFLPTIEPLARRIAFLPAPGNHDVNWGSPTSRRPFAVFFSEILNQLGQLRQNAHLLQQMNQRLWYSFTYGGALFVALDSNLLIDEGRYRRTHELEAYQGFADEQLRWLVDLLEAAHQDPGIRAKFIYFHHSPIVSYQQGPVPLLRLGGHPGHTEMLVKRRLPTGNSGRGGYFLDLFRDHEVTAVFSGHEHYYERWKEIITQDGVVLHSLNWIVNGSGGVKPRGRPRFKPEQIREVLQQSHYRNYLGRISQSYPQRSSRLQHVFPNAKDPDGRFPHYLLVTVEGDRVTFISRDASGRVRDSGVF